MKKEFSKAWKSSKRPGKQRKYLANAPLHIRKKFLSVNLSKELRKTYKRRNISLKKGDIIKIMRGKFKGKQGKIKEVKLKISKVIIEVIQIKKQDGSKVDVKLQPSNLQIIELNTEDKRRFKQINKQKAARLATSPLKDQNKSKHSENASKKTKNT